VSGAPGSDPAAAQAPGQPWWRNDPGIASAYQQAAPAGYQTPHAYPGPYQAPPVYPGPPPVGPPARPPGSRKPLIYGLAAGLAAVVIAAAGFLVSHHLGSSTTPGGKASPGATGQASATSGSTVSPREQAAENLSKLLAQSVVDRSSIVAAVDDVGSCGPALNTDPQTLENAAVSRQNLLNELASLPGRSNLPQNLLAALTSAWQNSMQADKDYAQWAQDEVSNGCTQNDTSDPNYRAAIGPDGRATTDKQAFVGLWNPIGTEYGLQTYQWNQL
jgi:hypothetical protein